MFNFVRNQCSTSSEKPIFDVDRQDAWDKVKNFLKGVVEALFGKVKRLVSSDLPAFLGESLGGAADDVQSFLLKKLAGGDKVLFRGAVALQVPMAAEAGEKYSIDGPGTKGTYRIDLSLDVLYPDRKAKAEMTV